ncbi:MAG TPA: hypothetical protein VNK46_16195 [Nitrospiraceae bacterium]|nr:hypothetical protein [Nitrospiraceae bacterium]
MPVLVQDHALQPLGEALGPRVPGLSARVADAQGPAGFREGPLELRAAVGQHAPQGQPARRWSGARIRPEEAGGGLR